MVTQDVITPGRPVCRQQPLSDKKLRDDSPGEGNMYLCVCVCVHAYEFLLVMLIGWEGPKSCKACLKLMHCANLNPLMILSSPDEAASQCVMVQKHMPIKSQMSVQGLDLLSS